MNAGQRIARAKQVKFRLLNEYLDIGLEFANRPDLNDRSRRQAALEAGRKYRALETLNPAAWGRYPAPGSIPNSSASEETPSPALMRPAGTPPLSSSGRAEGAGAAGGGASGVAGPPPAFPSRCA